MNLIIHRQCTPVANNNRIPWKVYVKHLRHVKKKILQKHYIFLKKIMSHRVELLYYIKLNLIHHEKK